MNPSGIERERIRRISWGVLIFAGLAYAVGLWWFAERMAPVQRGTPEMFWMAVSGMPLTGEMEEVFWLRGGRFVDGYAVYQEQHMHGTHMFYVPAGEALAQFEAVLAALEAQADSGEATVIVNAYRSWRESSADRDARSLVEHLNAEWRRHVSTRTPNFIVYFIGDEMAFHRRWWHVKWYWVNFVFEWMLLMGLTLFAVWPGLRRQSHWRWAAHVLLLPMLFLLPMYLGYATRSFTSVGPSGGVLYPIPLFYGGRMIRQLGRMNGLDRWLLEHVPPLLEPLSISTGSPIAVTGMGTPGPTSALIVGIVLASGVLIGRFAYQRWARAKGLPAETGA